MNATQTHNCNLGFDSICIIGLGLIGASLAGALKEACVSVRIAGVDTDLPTLVEAESREWIDKGFSPQDEGLKRFLSDECQLVVVATPVQAVDGYFQLLADCGFSGVVTDTISTKAHILQAADQLLPPSCDFIPGHPMAGSERSGIAGARADLFKGINWILCPDKATVPENFQHLHEMITGIEARVISLPREEHDRAVAVVSHVPHMIAASLMQLASNHADDSQSLMRLAAGGFKDTTRIAAGSPKLWCGIAFDNAEALADGLEEMRSIIGRFAEALESGNREEFTALLQLASDARRSLPAAWVPSTDKLLEVRIPMINRNGVVAEVTTIASAAGCNIQSIEIDHISEGNAVLSLVLTDEGNVGKLSIDLINAGYSVSFSPLMVKEHAHVD